MEDYFAHLEVHEEQVKKDIDGERVLKEGCTSISGLIGDQALPKGLGTLLNGKRKK